MNTLTQLYVNNIIDYPRVFNGYSPVKSSHFPHAELAVVNKLLEPLHKKEYELNKASSLLYLSNCGLSEYNKISTINKYLSSNFTYELEPLAMKDKKVKKLEEKVLEYLDEERVALDKKGYYEENKYETNDLFAFKFLSNKKTLLNKKARVSDSFSVFKNLDFSLVTSIDDAIEQYSSVSLKQEKTTSLTRNI